MATTIPPQSTNVSIEDFQTFDYIVIGGGTAGLACAAKLSDAPNVTIGVIEAGLWRPDDPKINTPAMMGQPLMDPEYDWCLKTISQKHSNNREWILPRGRVLGGSSALNFLVWHRGFKDDFDDIAALGNPGWDWDSLTPVYNKLTTAFAPESAVQAVNLAKLQPALHGSDGPLHVSHAPWYCDLQKPWMDMIACHDDVKNIGDGSGSGDMHGTFVSLVSVDPNTMKRSYAATAFHATHDLRSNLKVLTGAHALRLLLEEGTTGKHPRVAGVMVNVNGGERIVRATREVILSAGTFKSPQLLELSGIGDEEILKTHGIPTRVHNPNIGKNLQEHLFIGSVFEAQSGLVTYDKFKDPSFAQKAMQLFGVSGQEADPAGSIAGSPVVTGFAFRSLRTFLDGLDIEELRKLADNVDTKNWSAGMKDGQALQLAKLFHDKTPAMEAAFMPVFFSTDGQPKDGVPYITSLTMLQYPLSRGTVHIASSDPMAAPAIDPAYFENPADLRLMALALKREVELIRGAPELRDKIVASHTPSPETVVTIEQYEEYVRQHCGTTYHPVGTCSMMPQDKGGVVDAQLRVYGIENLRIADASILPLMPAGHIQAACYVTGLKAAEMILAEFQ